MKTLLNTLFENKCCGLCLQHGETESTESVTEDWRRKSGQSWEGKKRGALNSGAQWATTFLKMFKNVFLGISFKNCIHLKAQKRPLIHVQKIFVIDGVMINVEY